MAEILATCTNSLLRKTGSNDRHGHELQTADRNGSVVQMLGYDEIGMYARMDTLLGPPLKCTQVSPRWEP